MIISLRDPLAPADDRPRRRSPARRISGTDRRFRAIGSGPPRPSPRPANGTSSTISRRRLSDFPERIRSTLPVPDRFALVPGGRHHLADLHELLGHLPRDRHPRTVAEGSWRLSTRVIASPGQTATHLRHPTQSPTSFGRPRRFPSGIDDAVRDADVGARVARDLLGSIGGSGRRPISEGGG